MTQTVQPGMSTLDGEDVTARGMHLGSGIATAHGEPVMKGHLSEVCLRRGLSLYASDVCDQQDLSVRTPLEPGLLLVMALSGQADVSYGARRFQLGPSHDAANRPHHEGLAITLTEPDAFERRLRMGARRRVVSLMLTPQWLNDSHDDLEQFPRIAAFRRTHLAAERWRLSPRLLALAGDLLQMQMPLNPLQALCVESRCLEIAAEALMAVAGETRSAAGSGLRPREQRRLAELCEFLDSGQGDECSLQALAQRIGMSASTLQRGFRAFTGSSVFEYQRSRRLRAARSALEEHGISIGEASHLAGYTSAANFSTAFRRQFGVSPGQLRARA